MNSSRREVGMKAFFGLVFLLVVMWVALFVPAWTFDFFQAWLFWLTFSSSTILITLYLLKKDIRLLEFRTRQGPSAEKEISQKIIQVFASIFFILLLIVPGIDHRYNWSDVPFYLSIVGDFFVLLGFIIVFFVFKENSFASGVIETDREQKVITTGPYRIVRHPMYTGGVVVITLYSSCSRFIFSINFCISFICYNRYQTSL